MYYTNIFGFTWEELKLKLGCIVKLKFLSQIFLMIKEDLDQVLCAHFLPRFTFSLPNVVIVASFRVCVCPTSLSMGWAKGFSYIFLLSALNTPPSSVWHCAPVRA
jgi:hypothetical protein